MDRRELNEILKRIERLGELAADRLSIILNTKAELAALKRENDKLRDALKAVVITRGRKIKYDEGYETYDPISIAKEALK